MLSARRCGPRNGRDPRGRKTAGRGHGEARYTPTTTWEATRSRKRGIHSGGAIGSPSHSRSTGRLHREPPLVKPATQPVRQGSDDGVMQRRQRLADGQQRQLARLAGDEDELRMPFHQLPHDVRPGHHQLHHAGAGQQFVGDRVAVTHAPHRLRLRRSRMARSAYSMTGLRPNPPSWSLGVAVVQGGPLRPAFQHLQDFSTGSSPCCRRSRRNRRWCHVPWSPAYDTSETPI